MTIAPAAFAVLVDDPMSWSSDWAWGLPLIVMTVTIHVLGLGLISQKASRASAGLFDRRHPTVAFTIVVGATTLLATSLHAFEAGLWALAYLILGALPDLRHSMLYSLNAITSYGHTDLALPDHWHLMGALEALNGWLLFGLTTAFLFAVIEKVWSAASRSGHR